MNLEMTREARQEADALRSEIEQLAATQKVIFEETNLQTTWLARARVWAFFALSGLGLFGVVGVLRDGLTPTFAACIAGGAIVLYLARRGEATRRWRATYAQQLATEIASKEERLRALSAPARLASLLGDESKGISLR
jgi:hypothetical protein